MREQQGHKGLERMGFDGAAIEKLRHLSGRQYEELLVILEQLHKGITRRGAESHPYGVIGGAIVCDWV